VVYVGRDLEAMSFAENYHRWILESLKPQLGTRLVEVGAGSGSFSDLLLDHPADAAPPVDKTRGQVAESGAAG
jgi:precorrin-6B methylase 2